MAGGRSIMSTRPPAGAGGYSQVTLGILFLRTGTVEGKPRPPRNGYFFLPLATAKSDLRTIALTPLTRSTTCVTWKSTAALA